MKISLFSKSYTTKACSFFITILLIAGSPLMVQASLFSNIFGLEASAGETPVLKDGGMVHNLQTIPLFESSINPDLNSANAEKDIIIVQDDSFIYNDAPFLSDAVFVKSTQSDKIKVYTVEQGDTLSEIAELFDVSTNTIRWENNISGSTVSIGQKLNILPMTGIKHIVKSGDTISGIADKYEAETEDIFIFNDIPKESILKQGDIIFVPNGIIQTIISKATSTISKTITSTSNTKVQLGYYARPVSGRVTSPYGSRKGGFHPGVDLAGIKGVTPVKAAASGVVVEVVGGCKEGIKSCGGGYGNHIEIVHSNGTTTRYAHLSKASVVLGQTIYQNQTIGILGNTGSSTGPHLHFEIINASGSKMRPPV